MPSPVGTRGNRPCAGRGELHTDGQEGTDTGPVSSSIFPAAARAVFLDKDGTLIEDVPYNVDPQRLRLTQGATEGLRRLHEAGYRLIVVSNQSGVARGLFTEEALELVRQRLVELLAEAGVPLAGCYWCPHHPDGSAAAYAVECDCRKPRPGLLLRAAREHGLELNRCWMVGDILNDVEAGRRAGCRTILIDNGNETEWVWSPLREPEHFASPVGTESEKSHECQSIATH
jgi:D-glycero-D-manno-heptose 1,7-bisphosphate phosphatase